MKILLVGSILIQFLIVPAFGNDDPKYVIGQILKALPLGSHSGHTSTGSACNVSAMIFHLGQMNVFRVNMDISDSSTNEGVRFQTQHGDSLSNFKEGKDALSVVFGNMMNGVPCLACDSLLQIRKNAEGFANAVYIRGSKADTGVVCILR